MEHEEHKITITRIARKTTLIGIGSSIILVLVKGIAGIVGHSYALVADAIESLTDIFTSSILLVGFKVASKPADENHPYGHGKAEPITALVVVLGLIAAATVIAIKSIQNLSIPHQVPEPFTLWILIAVVITKELVARYVKKIGESLGSQALKADSSHHRSDAITSIAAFIGISIALIGGNGYENADDYAALLASLVIYYNAYSIARPTLGELMDEAPSEDFVNRIKATALQTEQVMDLDKCYVRKMGFDFYVDLHVVVNGNLTVQEGHTIAHQVKDRILDKFKMVQNVIVHIEPYQRQNMPVNKANQ